MPCTPHSPYCCCCQQQGAIGNTAGLGEREGGWHIACCVLRPKMQLQQQQQHITSNFPEKRDPTRKLCTTYYWPLPNLGYRFIPLFFPLKYWEMTRNAQTLRESGSVCVCMLPWYLPPFPLFSLLCFVRLPHHPPSAQGRNRCLSLPPFRSPGTPINFYSASASFRKENCYYWGRDAGFFLLMRSKKIKGLDN